MSDAAARLLATAYILGFNSGIYSTDPSQGGQPPAQEVVDFMFSQHKTVVTQHWANDLIEEVYRGL